MYTIGDKIMFHPVFMHVDKDGRRLAGKPPVPGRVVYIHPLGRYLVVERRVDDRYTYREAFKLSTGGEQLENDSDHEPEGRRWKDSDGHQPGRRAGRRR